MDKKAEQLEAISKILEVNKTIGSYKDLEINGVRIAIKILQSIENEYNGYNKN